MLVTATGAPEAYVLYRELQPALHAAHGAGVYPLFEGLVTKLERTL